MLGTAQGLVLTLVRGVASLWRWREAAAARRRHAQQRAQNVLPSLYQRFPNARQVTRTTCCLVAVPLAEIVGTEGTSSQNTTDILTVPEHRGRNWRSR